MLLLCDIGFKGSIFSFSFFEPKLSLQMTLIGLSIQKNNAKSPTGTNNVEHSKFDVSNYYYYYYVSIM